MNKLLIALSLVVPGAPVLAQVQIPQAANRPAPSLQPGLYVHVVDGTIQLSNSGGAQNFSAGQFGYTPNVTMPPVVLPNNPGLQFTPPPVFNTGGSGPVASTGGKTGAVDCEVR